MRKYLKKVIMISLGDFFTMSCNFNGNTEGKKSIGFKCSREFYLTSREHKNVDGERTRNRKK